MQKSAFSYIYSICSTGQLSNHCRPCCMVVRPAKFVVYSGRYSKSLRYMYGISKLGTACAASSSAHFYMMLYRLIAMCILDSIS